MSIKDKEKIFLKEFISFLASTYALYLKTQNFHWNITGPHFVALHQFLDAQYKELAEAVDLIAEQIRALDHKVPANFSSFLKLSYIADSKENLDAKLMIKTLLSDHQTLRSNMKKMIVHSDAIEDFATQDLIIERLRSHEKTIWMLKSLLL